MFDDFIFLRKRFDQLGKLHIAVSPGVEVGLGAADKGPGCADLGKTLLVLILVVGDLQQ